MRILVCGSRTFRDHARLVSFLDSFPQDCTLIEGGARGADTIALEYALWRGWDWEEWPANWAKYGKAAGYKRNEEMLVEGKPDMVIAFFAVPFVKSRGGTRDMVERAWRYGVPVCRVFPGSPQEA